jgi:hypothetical protein
MRAQPAYRRRPLPAGTPPVPHRTGGDLCVPVPPLLVLVQAKGAVIGPHDLALGPLHPAAQPAHTGLATAS